MKVKKLNQYNKRLSGLPQLNTFILGSEPPLYGDGHTLNEPLCDAESKRDLLEENVAWNPLPYDTDGNGWGDGFIGTSEGPSYGRYQGRGGAGRCDDPDFLTKWLEDPLTKSVGPSRLHAASNPVIISGWFDLLDW
jgi:hypothetical protein